MEVALTPLEFVRRTRALYEALTLTERAVIKARQGVELITSGELRVVDEEGHDVPRDGATVGEIVVRGNVVMKGYYNDDEASAHALRGGTSTPATRRSYIPTATSTSATASRTSSSAEARTSLPWRLKV